MLMRFSGGGIGHSIHYATETSAHRPEDGPDLDGPSDPLENHTGSVKGTEVIAADCDEITGEGDDESVAESLSSEAEDSKEEEEPDEGDEDGDEDGDDEERGGEGYDSA
jgi:hypothetical protein